MLKMFYGFDDSCFLINFHVFSTQPDKMIHKQHYIADIDTITFCKILLNVTMLKMYIKI